MNNILDLEPKLVWKYFYDFTQTPRPSKHEEKILAYLVDFAEKNKLEYKRDATGNIVICKPATKGRENAPKVALQGHVDMVCEKNSDVEIDFMNDPIQAYIDGEWVKAKGTTLGADCGIGCSIALAILASNDLAHPAIEAVFTVDEETGLTGAFGIEKDMITAKYLINLDSEDAGEVFVGCAGGVDTLATFNYKEENIEKDSSFVEIKISGLQGGHSGDDINKKRGNANVLLSRFMFDYLTDIQIVEIDGGNLRNAIPREAKALLAVKNSALANIKEEAKKYNETLKKEYFTSDANVEFSFAETSSNAKLALDKKTTQNLVTAIITAPNEILAMSQDMDNFVETSTNLASVKQSEGKIVISTSQRSSVESRKEFWAKVVAAHFTTYGADVHHTDGYPGWTPILNSHLLEVFKREHKKVLGYDVAVKAIHAGLECGLFSTKFPQLEMVSYGPTLRGVHSPDEKLNIKDTQDAWKFIISILETI